MAMVKDQEKSYCTEAIRYSIGITTECQNPPVPKFPNHKNPALRRATSPCLVAQVTVGGRIRFSIPCTHLTDDDDEYYRKFQGQFAMKLQSEYLPRVVPKSCATRVAERLTSILRSAKAAHRCGGDGQFNVCIRITEFLLDETPLEKALRMVSLEGAAETGAKAAASRSVAGLMQTYMLLRA